MRGPPVGKERIGFVEDKKCLRVARLGEGGRDLLLGLADPGREQIGRALLEDLEPESLGASMPRRASSRAQIRALTRGVGRRSSSANIIRRRMVSLTPRVLFMVQRVGVGAASRSRCMYTLEPVLRKAMRE